MTSVKNEYRWLKLWIKEVIVSNLQPNIKSYASSSCLNSKNTRRQFQYELSMLMFLDISLLVGICLCRHVYICDIEFADDNLQ